MQKIALLLASEAHMAVCYECHDYLPKGCMGAVGQGLDCLAGTKALVGTF